MPLGDDERRRAVRYLLDDLGEEERESLERRLVTDDECFEAVQAIEEELVRDYFLKRLPTTERSRFERKYLSTPALRRRIEESRRLMLSVAALDRHQRVSKNWMARLFTGFPRFPSPIFTTIAACLVLLGALSVEVLRLRSRLSGVEGGVEVSFVLTPGAQRGTADTAPRRLLVNPGATVRLHLDLASNRNAPKYRGAIITPEGVGIWDGDIPSAQRSATGDSLDVRLPAGTLHKGDYILTLQANYGSNYETLDYYSFRVVSEGRRN